ncbi:MAG: hypothetical protein HY898_21965 [Deltaproteobacteria bacterium]|nr:hypothetical protein [Deltaproteobacteria bacterium]
MNRSRLSKVGVSVALAAAVVTAAATAGAGDITMTETNIKRVVTLRDQSKNPFWISRADCLADDVFTFPLYVTNYSDTATVQVWVGDPSTNNCKDTTARTGSAPTCWMVASSTAQSSNLTITVRAQDIVGQHKTVAGSTTGGPGSGTEADCTLASTSSTAPQPVVVNFMFVTNSNAVSGNGYGWPTKYDLAGPLPPTSLTLGQGDTMLKLSWPQATDTDLTGYQFFCDPLPGQEGAANGGQFEAGSSSSALSPGPVPGPEDAAADTDGTGGAGGTGGSGATGGAGGAGGTGGTGTAAGSGGTVSDAADDSDSDSETGTDAQGSECSTTKLFQGTVPDPALLCGSASGQTATEGRVTGLKNLYTYSIAVAAVDGVGNVGTLSPVKCLEPHPVDDFFKLYKEAGGEGGGSFCSVGAVGQGAGMVGFGVMTIAALARIARRRREDS